MLQPYESFIKASCSQLQLFSLTFIASTALEPFQASFYFPQLMQHSTILAKFVLSIRYCLGLKSQVSALQGIQLLQSGDFSSLKLMACRQTQKFHPRAIFSFSWRWTECKMESLQLWSDLIFTFFKAFYTNFVSGIIRLMTITSASRPTPFQKKILR